MAVNYEQDICHGRGFTADDADGFLANFAAWVVRTPEAVPASKSTGGPGWYIIDDQSVVAGSPNKFAEVRSAIGGFGSSFDTIAEVEAITTGEFALTIDGVSEDITGLDFTGVTTWAGVASVIQIAVRAASNGANDGFEDAICQISEHLYNDYPPYNDRDLVRRLSIVPGEAGMTITAAAVAGGGGLDLYGGSYLSLSVSELYSTDPYIVVSDQAAPTAFSGAKFIQLKMPTVTAGIVYVYAWMNWDSDIHKGLGMWGFWYLNTYDDADFVYDFRGGTDFLCIATRLGSSWNNVLIDNWNDDSNLIEDNTKVGNIVAATAVGAVSIEVGVGEGANFTQGNFYFLIDLDSSEGVSYVKIDTIAGDVITLNASYSLLKTFKAGSLLTPYYQRFYCWGNNEYPASREFTSPIRSTRGQEFGTYYSTNYGNCYSEMKPVVMIAALNTLAPDDKSEWAVQKPLVTEATNNIYYIGNRAFGVCKNMYMGNYGTMAIMLNGRTISSKQYIFLNTKDGFAVLIPNYNAI